MKRFVVFLTAIAILTICLIPAAATETTEPIEPTDTTEPIEPTDTTDPTFTEPASGSCGDAVEWSYSGGVLTISGSGTMYDCYEGAPWAEYSSEISTVIFSGEITYVGAYAFSNYDSLVAVNFGGSLEEIGHRAFYSCDNLSSVTLPHSFVCFGSECFMSCRNLKAFYCNGHCPSFRLNCLRDTYGIIYYPASRPWPLKDMMELEQAFHGRIEFLASDGTDPIPGKPGAAPPPADPPVTESPTEAPTEPPTETPTEPPTEVPTEAPTEPPAEVPTEEAATESPTEETTEEPTEPTTEATTEPPTEEDTRPTAEASTEAPSPESTEVTAVPNTKLTRSTSLLLPGILSCAAALLIPVILLFSSLRKRSRDNHKRAKRR